MGKTAGPPQINIVNVNDGKTTRVIRHRDDGTIEDLTTPVKAGGLAKTKKGVNN